MSEAELVKEIQLGSSDSFEKLFEKYKNTAFRTAYFISGNKFTAEDIVQETFVQCFLKIKSLKNPELFKPWFYKILTRTAWKHSNSDKASTPVENIFETAEQSFLTTEFNKSESECFETLHAEINNLDIKLKTTIILYYFNGFSVKEISKISGCFEGTVKSRLYTARKKLKDSLKDIKKRECEANGNLKAV